MAAAVDAELAALVDRARAIPTSILADAVDGAGVVDPAIAALTPDAELCGPALTARCAERDVLASLATLVQGKPGEVLVVGGCAAPVALLGEFMARTAVELGLGGVVLDGYVRDSGAIRATGLAVFSRGATPRIETRGDRGRSRVPVRCGGVDVAPGDLVRGDADGVMVVARGDLPAALERAEAKLAKEREAERLMAGGAGIEALYGEFLEPDGDGA